MIQRWGQAYPDTSQRIRHIISRYSDDAANQTYPTCRSILLLENPSPSLKSSKIACSFNSLCLLLSFIHSFIHSIKRRINYFIQWKSSLPSIIHSSNFQKRNKLEKIHIIRYACELCVKHCRRLFRTCIIPGFKKWTVNQKEINEIEKEWLFLLFS